MKCIITIGRKGNKYKCLYVGDDANEAIAKMDDVKAGTEDKAPLYDEVSVFRRPVHFKRRKLLA
jgi:hypothetical protein